MQDRHFRSGKSPTIQLPFGVRSVGHYLVEEGYGEKPVAKAFLQLFWGIEGKGLFRLGEEDRALGPGQVFVYFPGNTHNIQALSTPWRYRWLSLDGNMNTQIANSLGLFHGPRMAGPCPENLFVELESHVQNVTPLGERKACATAFAILTLAGGRQERLEAEDRRIKQWIDTIESQYQNPEFGIGPLAEISGIHRSLLCRIFKQKLGLTPSDYLISVRIQKAMSLLKKSELTVQQVSLQVGYRDPNYFCKAMKKVVGSGPREFRSL